MLQNLTVDNLILVAGFYFGFVFLVTSLAVVIWTARDIRARTRDNFLFILSTVLVVVLNLPGLLIYLFLRPRETLSEAYERHTRLKKPCIACGEMLHLSWNMCPVCATIQSSGTVEQPRSSHASRRIAKPNSTSNQWEPSSNRTAPTDQQVTFVDENY